MYYLLSRSLGPEFGGSIGLIYFLGTVIGCGMNVLGFVEPLISNFGESSGTVYRVLPESKVLFLVFEECETRAQRKKRNADACKDSIRCHSFFLLVEPTIDNILIPFFFLVSFGISSMEPFFWCRAHWSAWLGPR